MNDPASGQHSEPIETAARELRVHHRLATTAPRPIPAWTKIRAMADWLGRARACCADPAPEAAKAAEWLLDNAYRVRRAVRQVRTDLSAEFYQRLPGLADDDGLPRVFALAHGLLEATRLQLSLTGAVQFMRAYQEEAPLTIAELWAFPTMLRLACLEVMVDAFQRIFPTLTPPFEITGHAELYRSFDDTECVSRALANLGAIASILWKDFFDRTSRVEALLQRDPAGVYPAMTFATRDRYRRVVEELAAGSATSEAELAELTTAAPAGEAPPRDHVGYWLIGAGRTATEARIGYTPTLAAAWRNRLFRNAGALYAGALVAAGVAGLMLPASYLAAVGAGPVAWIVGIALALLPASIFGVTLVHWIVTLVVPPRVLPKLDFEDGIPPSFATAVVVPVIVGGPDEIPGMIERLEMHRLANPDPTLQFALLSDHVDAPAEHMPGDAAVEEALVDGIRRLNARYGPDGDGPFHLLHRARRYNPSEGCWMGWERKRGKLEQFNRFVLGEETSGFPLQEANPDKLVGIRFVVTVDADTTLPPGSVNRLAGALAHPLNRAEFDPATGRVSAGYTVVQPRVEISPDVANRSLFARLYTGDTAVDIYSRAVSDVYQDMFGEGIFTGKGIYDVAAFQRSLDGRVPENTLVSHDLFEGIQGRCALASDIVLYEGFPAGYLEHARRWRRWVRGDWQLVPWLGRAVPGADGGRIASRLSNLDRWKILDNLRRSLVPISLVALAAAGWLMLPGSPWVWTILAVAVPGAHLFTDLVTGLARGRRRGAVRSMLRRLADHGGRWLLAIVFLLNDAAVALDAIACTLWRLFVSRRHLLEWTSAAHVASRLAGRSHADAVLQMWVAPAGSAATGAVLAVAHPAALLPAAPLLLLWFLSPGIAAWTSRPRRPPEERLPDRDRAFLRRLARRTWLFFEAHVGPDDNWLPPDNFQEAPYPEVAHRTSPTNIGMMLLSYLTAWDFGHVGSADFAARSRNALDTLDRLVRYRGHLLNWYDTRLLEPLEPRYVSTVDSGNLAVCLVALKGGCAEIADTPVLRPEAWDGLVDTIGLLVEALDMASVSGGPVADLRSRATAIVERALSVRDRPGTWRAVLGELCDRECPELEAMIGKAIALPEAPPVDAIRAIHTWLGRVHHHLTGMRRDIETLHPWQALADAPPPGCEAFARRVGEALAPTLPPAAIAEACDRVGEMLTAALAELPPGEAAGRRLADLAAAVRLGREAQERLRTELIEVAARADATAFDMDFRLLYDHESRLFYIGYNVSSDRLDQHHYDLLASEARLASYFAIAKKDVPVEHWFFLGRPIARLESGLSLISWNGSMFEYLMPPLLLRSGRGTLVGQSERAAVDAQRRHVDRLDIPWGISESAFALLNPDHHYRYHAFGVPRLGLRRGLSRDLVIAPYASALALATEPRAAVANLRALKRLGLIGAYGFFDAADFTPGHVPAGRAFSPVRTYMAHHQGMILAAVGNALFDDAHVRRFREERRMRSIDLLLQERIPWELPAEEPRAEERPLPALQPEAVAPPHPWAPPASATFPQMHLLGNGRLASWISESGGGGLWWNQQALTRWRPDSVRDNHGLWIYVRDEESGTLWSVGRQPTGVASPDARVVFHPHLAEFHRRDNGIGIRMEVAVAPADDIEIRRVTVVNESDRARTISLTSYGEVVLAPPLDDERHPAFSKLFVGSEYLAGRGGLLFTRRPRNPGDHPPVLLHCIVADEAGLQVAGYETDRRAFLGRNGDGRLPHGVGNRLSGTVGWTLDPVMSLQLRLDLEPRERRHLAFLTFVAGSRESVMELADRHTTLASLDWTVGDAATEAARETQQLRLEPSRLPELQMLASLLLHPHPTLRAPSAVIAANRLGQPRLWGLGLSGDLPILLIRAGDPDELGLLPVLIRALRLWQRRGFQADIVVLRTGTSGYVEPVRDRFLSLVGEAGGRDLFGHRGGVHLVFADQIGEEDRCLIETAARVVLDESRGPLAQQLAVAAQPRPSLPRLEPSAPRPEPGPSALPRPADLAFDNGLGGFADDGRDYVIRLAAGSPTPAPWCNVLANDEFGCIVTEAGGGFTWAVNSGENRLTPWTNDPVADGPSEVLYLRDEETAEIWTPTPRPAGAEVPCEIRHGAGHTTWRCVSHGLEQELVVFVPLDQPVKLVRLRLRNLLPQGRRVTATYYAEWLLGALPSVSRPFVVCDYDARCQALMARNPWNPDFGERVAFLTSSRAPHSLTTDRLDFLGREGDPRRPAGLRRWDLGGRIEPGADACAAFQVHLDIDAESATDVVFVLGQGRDRSDAEELALLWQEPARAESALREVTRHWDRLLGSIHVRTPDPAFDLMLNRWLLYQALSSRVLARAGFYQAGGALGFRDQLQDVMALFHADPGRARAHILAAAARQFEEGDVLHWWHPPCDRGVRTRCSDDLLWLPYVVSRYVEATGDESILGEDVPFLRAPPLGADEDDRYARFETAPDARPLFEHCLRALERGITRGPHGLPLIGSGDWNDGMNRVGRRGRGESVWLAWFGIAAMLGFAGLAARLGRDDLGESWTRRAEELRRTIEATAWDGRWYLRAFDDDGRAWGSSLSDECRIDSITQSWAVLAGGDVSARARAAVRAAAGELVSDDDRLVRLLWPPFQDTPRDPGYIKAYPPGIRENGGQYTHGAAWLGLAFAEIGDGDSAHHVFDLLNPVRHAASPAEAERFRVEPYVIAADVAGAPPYIGRGGWTWYTGSAAWTWRLGVEGILGLRLRGGDLMIDPCLPKGWGRVEAELRGPAGTLAIRIEDPDRLGRGAVELIVDGERRGAGTVAFPTDGSVRQVLARIGRAPGPGAADDRREAVAPSTGPD